MAVSSVIKPVLIHIVCVRRRHCSYGSFHISSRSHGDLGVTIRYDDGRRRHGVGVSLGDETLPLFVQAGHHKMVPCVDKTGTMTANMISAHAVAMAAIPVVSTALGVTDTTFLAQSTLINGFFLYHCFKFQKVSFLRMSNFSTGKCCSYRCFFI